ncbi:NRDE family protein [Bacillus sp. EB01]|uniref:NRDE family protein n=1 Tax=Bacillus sp. EB01 TaxID=1347086 RepID=UPI0005C6BD85|nr:NRDE family protein [Bacillus sp. EB01]
MCLILFAYKVHPRYPLIVASNRDESYERPTAAAHFWEDQPHLLAGRDLEKLGTWMGVTKLGRFAALTNFRDPKEMKATGQLSRGELVADFLRGKASPENYLKAAAQKGSLYPGFNLLAGDQSNLYYYSNIEGVIREVPPGIHGVSNHLLNTPWPKVERGKKGLESILDKEGAALKIALFQLLKNTDPAEDADLPDTGVGLELERMLSPMFIRSKGYGTRCSTILLMEGDRLSYTERIYDPKGNTEKDFSINF